MKIRTDFVTNSSSTSFIIITEAELTRGHFLELMGIEKASPLSRIFEVLYESLEARSELIEGDEAYQSRTYGRLLPHVKERIAQAREQGYQVFIGELSSDDNGIESFFCTDSFEIEEDGFFLSALENSW